MKKNLNENVTTFLKTRDNWISFPEIVKNAVVNKWHADKAPTERGLKIMLKKNKNVSSCHDSFFWKHNDCTVSEPSKSIVPSDWSWSILQKQKKANDIISNLHLADPINYFSALADLEPNEEFLNVSREKYAKFLLSETGSTQSVEEISERLKSKE
jgi:hypothetical protein